MSRVFLLVIAIVATAGAALAYGDPKQISKAGNLVTEILRKHSPEGAKLNTSWPPKTTTHRVPLASMVEKHESYQLRIANYLTAKEMQNEEARLFIGPRRRANATT